MEVGCSASAEDYQQPIAGADNQAKRMLDCLQNSGGANCTASTASQQSTRHSAAQHTDSNTNEPLSQQRKANVTHHVW